MSLGHLIVGPSLASRALAKAANRSGLGFCTGCAAALSRPDATLIAPTFEPRA